MTIIRIRKRKPGFTVIDNQPINDSSLRWETLGLFTYLMSKPDGWEINVNHLWKLKRGAGRDKTYRMLKELETGGYFRQERLRRPDGTFDWVKTLYETPQPLPENQGVVFQDEKDAELPLPENQEMAVRGENCVESPLPGLPYTAEPDTANQDALVNTDLVSTEIVNTDLVSSLGISNKQQQHARARTRAKIVVAGDFSIWSAFRLAGIKKPTARRIPGAWKKSTGADITSEDILAWHFYREAENLNLPAGRKLRPALIIANLESGERADDAFYNRAREYLAELAAENAETSEPGNLELLGLRRSLEAFLPPAAEIGLEALDAMSRRLPDVSEALHAQGATPEDLNDLRLYLIYTNQPVPLPEQVGKTLAGVGADFQTWRERKAEAARLWRHIVQQSSMAAPGSAIDQAMKRATPVDLNGALVVMAEPSLETYFQRLWPRKAASILSQTRYSENLPIRFISQSQ